MSLRGAALAEVLEELRRVLESRVKELVYWARRRADGAPADDELREAVHKILADHDARCRAHGVYFPKLTVLTIPSKSIVSVLRRDLDPASISNVIRNLVVEYSPLHAEEVARAVTIAFPDYRPGLIDLSPLREGVKPSRAMAH